MIKKRIIILDDEPLIPVLIKEMIEEDQELEISRITGDKKEFLESVRQDHFDAALIDISVGGRDGGIELLETLKSKDICLPLVMLSAHDEGSYALRCLQAGAKGYISKSNICNDLIRGLKEIFCGHSFVSGEKGDYILKQYKK